MERSYKTFNRYFCAILYEEDPNFKKYYDSIQKEFTEVTFILHNRDYLENGEKKKEHYHIIFKVGSNARSVKSVAEQIEIPMQYLEGINKDNYLLYMIHYGKQNKAKYEVEEINGELKERLKQLLEKKKSQEEVLSEILEEITTKRIKRNGDLLKWGIENKQVDIIRKYSFILTNMLKEMKELDLKNKKC